MKHINILVACACMWLSSLTLAHAQTAPTTLPALAAVKVDVTDLDRSERFYREVFGLAEAQRYGHERVFSLPGAGAPRITLVQVESANGGGSLAIIVADIDAVINATGPAGGRVTREPQEMNMGGRARIGFIQDPDGVDIELIEIVAAASE